MSELLGELPDYRSRTCPWQIHAEGTATDLGRCDSPLHLVRHSTQPIFAGSTNDDLMATDDWGWTSAWAVECENGHKLLLSTGEENAEPFDIAWVDAIGAGTEERKP